MCYNIDFSKISFGPVSKLASWEYFKEIADFIGCSTFTRYPDKDCKIAVWIKDNFYPVNPAMKNILIPIDSYTRGREVEKRKEHLSQFDLIITPNNVFDTCLMNLGFPQDRFIEIQHHNRFGLGLLPTYKEDGFLLYIGHAHYLKDFLEYRRLWYKPPIETIALTNWNNPIQVAASGLSKQPEIDGVKIYQWTPELQEELIQSCKLTIDIKTEIQELKPATKIQQMLCHGTAAAGNYMCYARNWLFSHYDFVLADPSQFEYWSSKEYFNKCQAACMALRRDLGLMAITNQYCKLFAYLLAK